MAQEKNILSADLSEEGVLRLTMDDQKTKNSLSKPLSNPFAAPDKVI